MFQVFGFLWLDTVQFTRYLCSLQEGWRVPSSDEKPGIVSSKYCITAIDTPRTVNEAGCLAIFGFRLRSSDVSSTNTSCKNMFLSLQERVLIFYICGKFNFFLHPEILQTMLNWSRSDGTSSIRIDAGCPERTASRIPHSSQSKSDWARFSWKQTLKILSLAISLGGS